MVYKTLKPTNSSLETAKLLVGRLLVKRYYFTVAPTNNKGYTIEIKRKG